MCLFDLNNLALKRSFPNQPKPQKPKEKWRKIKGKFLKGPVPMDWLKMAANLSGKALHVGIALWHLVGLEKRPTVKLSGKLLREMGVQRSAGYRAVNELENAQLISTEKHRGRCPIVTILDNKFYSER